MSKAANQKTDHAELMRTHLEQMRESIVELIQQLQLELRSIDSVLYNPEGRNAHGWGPKTDWRKVCREHGLG